MLRLITAQRQLEDVATRAARASIVAVDIEGNGLHAFRPKLCALQLAWPEDDAIAVAIVDTIALDIRTLAPVLQQDGPLKLLHDLTFDARMLQDAGVTLGHVRDTSVAARFLGKPATGLASLLAAHFEIEMNKRLQDHDWARRPITDEQLAYLAGDVLHLHALDDELGKEAAELGITAEIEVECDYKLKTALAPPRDQRPAYIRIKGYRSLLAGQRAILRRLVERRDVVAEQRDVPPFRVASNKLLLSIARAMPKSMADLRPIIGGRRQYSEHELDGLLAAVRLGTADGEPPPEDDPPKPPQTISRREQALRKHLDSALGRWRRAEADSRKVDLQVVLPGHCVGPVISVLATSEADAATAQLSRRLAGVEGMCASRMDRYAEQLSELARGAHGKADADVA